MLTINSTDKIFATGSYLGEIIVNFVSTGFESVSDVLSAVAAQAGISRGLLKVRLSNATQGWTQARSLLVTPPPAGTQLTLW